MSRFDPDPNVPYGECITCGVALDTEQDADDHRSVTLDQARESGGPLTSHSTRGNNPPRHVRIRREMSHIVEYAISKAMDDIDRHVQRGDLTEEEASEGLGLHSDFQDAWDEYTEGGGD